MPASIRFLLPSPGLRIVCRRLNERLMTQDKIGNQLGLTTADFLVYEMSLVIYLTVPRISHKGRTNKAAPSGMLLIASSEELGCFGAPQAWAAPQFPSHLEADCSFQPVFIEYQPWEAGPGGFPLLKTSKIFALQMYLMWFQNLTQSRSIPSVYLSSHQLPFSHLFLKWLGTQAWPAKI